MEELHKLDLQSRLMHNRCLLNPPLALAGFSGLASGADDEKEDAAVDSSQAISVHSIL